MSDTDVRDDLDEEVIAQDDEHLHIRCCKSNPPRFICRYPFHPELGVTDETFDESKICLICAAFVKAMKCFNPWRGPHYHCPLDGEVCHR